MADDFDITPVGELVDRDGFRLPLRSAVTLIGSGGHCDLVLPGLADLHCVLTNTPAGPVLRSWHPADTLVNGDPTAARVLADGDDLDLGPSTFSFVWHWDIIPLTAAPTEVVPVEHQHAGLADLLERRHRQLADLFADVATAREELRQARAKAPDLARTRRRQAERLRKAARADRLKAKRLARKFIARIKARHRAEHDALVAGRLDLAAEAARLRAKQAAADADYERRTRDLAAAADRLSRGWAALADHQGQLQADRAALALPPEVALVVAPDDRARLEAEIARLEKRADAAAAAVQRLEQDRTLLTGGPIPGSDAASDGVWLNVIPLQRDPAKSADELISDLARHDQELTRERSALTAATSELARRAADLHDQRAVVADHLAGVLVARHSWHLAEAETVDELEAIAHAVAEREAALDARERSIRAVDADRLSRAQEMWRLRLKLEAWQSTLATSEAAAQAHRDRVEGELAAKRAHLEQWEAALADLCRKWSAARKQEVWQLRDELDQWAAARARHRLAAADADEVRTKLLAELATAAAATMTAGEVHDRLVALPRGRSAARQLRLTGRRYERQFRRLRQEVDAHRDRSAAETAAADARLRELHKALVAAHERQNQVATDDQAAAANRLALARQVDARAAEVEAEAAKYAHAADELAAVRAEVERLAGLLYNGGDPREPVPVLKLAA